MVSTNLIIIIIISYSADELSDLCPKLFLVCKFAFHFVNLVLF